VFLHCWLIIMIDINIASSAVPPMAERPLMIDGVEILFADSSSESSESTPKLSSPSRAQDKERAEHARLFISEINTTSSSAPKMPPTPDFKGSRRPGVRSASASPAPHRNDSTTDSNESSSHKHHRHHHSHHRHHGIHKHHVLGRKRSKSFDLNDKVRRPCCINAYPFP